jgi:ATP-binding cassette subfamily B protein
VITKIFTLGEYLAGRKDSRLRKGFIFAFIESLFVAIPFGIVILLIRRILERSLTFANIWWFTGAVVTCVVLRLFFSQAAMVYIFSASHYLMGHARVRVADHLRKLPMGFFSRYRSGELTGVLTTDIALVEDLWSHMIGVFTANFFLPLLVGVAMTILDWRLGLIILLSLPVAFLMLSVTTPLFIRHIGRAFEAGADANARIVEYAQGIAILRTFGRHGDGYKRLETSMKDFRDALIKAEVIPAPLLSIFGFIIEGSFVLVAALGAHFSLNGSLAPSTFLIFLVVTVGVSKQVADLGVTMLMLRASQKALSRVESLLNEKPLPDALQHVEIHRHDVSAEDVTFSYENEPALKNISATFPERSFTAIVGKSGSGKSTLVHLIARLWDIPRGQGAIKIGGMDIRDIPIEELHQLVTMVFQDVVLFSGSVINNIRIGKPTASLDEVIAACKKAQAHGFIQNLPQGYDTLLGEGGGNLSGGERQRISIARALLKDAPIILLDEATASIDASSESEIQKAIDGLLSEKTVIVIAHRLKTIQRASKIVVLDQGNLVEEGTHAELIAKDGVYAGLWREQQRGKGWKICST